MKDLHHFSKEHHESILFAWRIKREIKNNTDIEVVRKYIGFFWKKVLINHLEAEKELLLKHLETNSTIKSKIETEHESIMSLADRVMKKHSEEKALFLNLAEKIREQIYFEEAVLFPYLRSE